MKRHFPSLSFIQIVLQIWIIVSLMGGGSPAATPTLVQLAGGETIAATTVPVLERKPETVGLFVEQTVLGLYNWSATIDIPGEGPKLDPGISINTEKGSYSLPTRTWLASFALEPGFDESFRQEIAPKIPRSITDGSASSILLLSFLGDPRPVEDVANTWTVDVVGEIKILNNDRQQVNAIPLVQRITAQAIPLPAAPLGETDVEKAIYQARLRGLQITDMSPLQQES